MEKGREENRDSRKRERRKESGAPAGGIYTERPDACALFFTDIGNAKKKIKKGIDFF